MKNDTLICDIDGDALCIYRTDFIDLPSSPTMFIKLTKKQLLEFGKVKTEKNVHHKIGAIYIKGSFKNV